MGRWYKQANGLANSLGIGPGEDTYKELQSFEKTLKERGDWQKILSVRKKSGQEEAKTLLLQTLQGYKDEPEVNCVNVSFEGKTSTGGEWYSFGDHQDFYELNDTYGGDENKSEMLNHEEDKIYAIIQDDIDQLGERLIEQKVGSLIAKLEKRKNSILERFNVADGRQLAFPFYNAKEKTLKKYDSLISETSEKVSVLREGLKELTIEYGNEDEVESWFEDNLDEDISIEDMKEEAGDSIWEGYIEALQNEVGEHQSNYSKNVTSGGSWCISQPSSHFEGYLAEGNNFLILRRNGQPRIAIRSGDGYGIAEVQGTSNNADNITGLDFIDLLNTPYFDWDEIMQGILDSPNCNWDEDDLKVAMLEEVLEIDDKETSPEFLKAFTESNGEEFIKYLANDSIVGFDSLVWFLNTLTMESVQTKIGQAILDGIIENLDSIESMGGRYNDQSKGKWSTWAHKIIEMWEHINDPDIVKEIFGQNDEFLDDFFESIASSDQPSESINWAIMNIEPLVTIWGDKAKEHFDKLNARYQSFEGMGNLESYVRERKYLTNDVSSIDPEMYHQIMNNLMNKWKSNYSSRIDDRDVDLINKLWEFGQLVVPPMGLQGLAAGICKQIIETIQSSNMIIDSVDRAGLLIDTILNRLPDKLSPDLYSILKGSYDLKSSLEILDNGANINLSTEVYNDFARKLGLPLKSLDMVEPPLVEGIPNAPEISPVTPAINPQRPIQAKKKGWYKG